MGLCRLALVMVAAGCATAPPRPSSLAERTPNEHSITRDNPGGDAQSPVDAALTRLLSEPLGTKHDKFDTLTARFPDAGNWRRTRFWGYPTRAGFRYGKEPNYAISVVAYANADSDDSPAACLERYAQKARRTAAGFDVDLLIASRDTRWHARGVESVDWVKLEAERRARIEARRRQLRERLAGLRFKGRLRRPPGQPAAPSAADSGELPGTHATVRPGGVPKGEPRVKRRRVLSTKQLRRRLERVWASWEAKLDRYLLHGPFPEADVEPAPPPLSPEELWRLEQRRLLTRFGKHDMPIIRASGQFSTVFESDRYLGAIVAFRSWPGTCLVQGFAVRVGTDDALAAEVVQRWLDEVAPWTMWNPALRAAPPLADR
jgi:hypothetical protein